jgi:4'-phosphopantetheinyl transferase
VVRDADTLPIRSPWPVGEPAAPVGDGADDGIGDGTVRIWLADLDRPPLPAEHLERHLSSDERARAARFRFDVHRRRFATGRGLLRELLGRLLGAAPASLSFAYGAKGKPSLPGSGLGFNLSHSQNAALLGVCRGRELGVDIEHMRRLDDAAGLVERFFAPREREIYAGLPGPERLAGFYTGWTRKEAYVKARGDGLSLPTTAFEVEMAPGSRARLLRFEEEPDEVGRWTLAGLEPADGFLGAVAVEAPSGEQGPGEDELEPLPGFWAARSAG